MATVHRATIPHQRVESEPVPSRPSVATPGRWALLAVACLGFAVAQSSTYWLPLASMALLGVGVGLLRPWYRPPGTVAPSDRVLAELRRRTGPRPLALPPPWRVESDLRWASGEGCGGDVLVTSVERPGALDLVLVDVSGHGRTAAGRALLAAGAFSALLETLPPGEFLVAANSYLLRHGEEDSFATAVHLCVDLRSGDYVLRVAGHPPVVQFRAGSGRWDVLDQESRAVRGPALGGMGAVPGPALGVLAGAVYPPRHGRLLPGDAMLLYTDGLVESRRIDVGRGIDRLVGHADRVIARNLPGGAALIADAIRAEDGDDRALVLIRRAP